MTITALYNFVPISEFVCTAEALGLPSEAPMQDVPQADALCGEIEIVLTGTSPLLVAGPQVEPDQHGRRVKRFFTAPGGTTVIPGSSVRGMIRNVIEITSFARMSFVEDRRFGMRDLTSTARLDYGERMSRTTRHTDGQDIYTPCSLGGWLTRTADGLFLEPVEFGRIEHTELERVSPGFRARSAAKGKGAGTAEELQNLFSTNLRQTVWMEREPTQHQHSVRRDRKGIEVQPYLEYRKTWLSAAGGAAARRLNAEIVFTGMPSDRKHMEFVFPLCSGNPGDQIAVTREVWSKFLDVHENLEKKSPTWLWRKRALEAGDPIPVFFLLKQGATSVSAENIDQIGLSMMFKLAGDQTTHEMIAHSSRDHLKPDLIDLPTRMFGRITEDGKGSFRGRVSFGALQYEGEGSPPAYREGGVPAILAAPKPSYVPSYVRQRDVGVTAPARLYQEKQAKAQHRSYMRWDRPNGATGHTGDTLRGWKRYPARRGPFDPPPFPPGIDATNGNVVSVLHPHFSDAGLRFTGRIRFHNLHRVELGALLWALSWGGRPALRHGLGMGKPFGWGQVGVEIRGLDIAWQDGKPIADYLEDFTDAMDAAMPERLGGAWEETPQIRSLLAMADPESDKPPVGYMPLKDPADPKKNLYVKAKTDGHILPEIGITPADLGISPVQPANIDKIKRLPTPQEQRDQQENARQQAKSGVAWIQKGQRVREIATGDVGTAMDQQTSETGTFRVLFPDRAAHLSRDKVEPL